MRYGDAALKTWFDFYSRKLFEAYSNGHVREWNVTSPTAFRCQTGLMNYVGPVPR